MSAPHAGSGLEKRGRAALPSFSFFLRDVFHLVHVGAGLGKDVVQVVSNADEGESLFQEFADAGGAEEEESENDFVLAGVLDEFLGGGVELRREMCIRDRAIPLTEAKSRKAWKTWEKPTAKLGTLTSPPFPIQLSMRKRSCLLYTSLTSERGPIPKVIVEAWQQIWNREDQGQLGGKRAYKTDFEVYDQRAHDPQDSQIDIYVGVK